MQSNNVVHNKRDPFDVYIGRPSKWGNPFSHKEGTKAQFKVATREEAVTSYEGWLFDQPELVSCRHELRDKVLGCWCAPLACHGEILAMLASLYVIAGTGSRSVQNASREGKAALMEWLKDRLSRAKEQYGDRLVVMSGMAEGFDLALAIVALGLDIKLWVAIPSKDYGDYYYSARHSLTGTNRIETFNKIVDKKAWHKTCVMPTPRGTNGKYGGANFDRNIFMVNVADEFLVYDRSSTGTEHCFKALESAGKPYEEVPKVR